MKVLTVQQPYATLIAIGAKTIETRSWTTEYRGQLAIHSSKAFPVKNQSLLVEQPFRSVFDSSWPGRVLICGYILATCNLVGVLPILPNPTPLDTFYKSIYGVELTDNELAFGDYTPGRFAWILKDVKMLDNPIPAKGMLGLWESPRCHCDSDGECEWKNCPQKIDYKSICPLYELQSREYESED